jgi:hypothetical protein
VIGGGERERGVGRSIRRCRSVLRLNLPARLRPMLGAAALRSPLSIPEFVRPSGNTVLILHRYLPVVPWPRRMKTPRQAQLWRGALRGRNRFHALGECSTRRRVSLSLRCNRQYRAWSAPSGVGGIDHEAATSFRADPGPVVLRLGNTRGTVLLPPRHRCAACVDHWTMAGCLVINPFLSLWLSGADAWMGATGALSPTEMLREQIKMTHAVGTQAVRFWGGAWMFPAPTKQQTLAERMSALSLRVVEGGRR